MSIAYRVTNNTILDNIRYEDMSFNEVDYEKFIQIAKNDPNLTNGLETYYNSVECKRRLKEIAGEDYNDENLSNRFYLFYLWNENLSHNFGYISYNSFSKTLNIELYHVEDFKSVNVLYDIAKQLNMTLYNCDKHVIIDDAYLVALRIKEENHGIKLTKEQSNVLSSIEDQCRWWYMPTEDVSAIFDILGIQTTLKETDIIEIINDVQFENKIAVATFTGHTIIFGFNAPYISYPNLDTYLAKKERQTPHLQEVLNKLSKAFGTAAYFEYNNDDEMIASLAWSSKGKFVYGRFTSEGEGIDVFGTQKKAMEVNQKTIIKTAKKLGMIPKDILTGLMKQKQNVRYFTQCDWNIEDMLKRYSGK